LTTLEVPAAMDTLSADSTSEVYDGADLTAEPDTPSLTIEEVRIQEIEELLADQQDGLVELSNTEMAALQRELADSDEGSFASSVFQAVLAAAGAFALIWMILGVAGARRAASDAQERAEPQTERAKT